MEFILSRMYDDRTGLILRRYRDGEAAISGFLDDYAFLIAALLDLYETDFDPSASNLPLNSPGKMRRAFRRPRQRRVLHHSRGRPKPGRPHEGRLRRRRTVW